MEPTTLVSQLQTQVANAGKITLDASILDAAELLQVQNAFGLMAGQYLSIEGLKGTDIPSASGNSISITAGTISVLNLTALTVKSITFTAGDRVGFMLVISMPATWTFTDSFPALNFFPFDVVTVSGAGFVYSSQPVTGYPLWPAGTANPINLAAGLNMGADLSIAGLSLLQALLGTPAPAGSLKAWGAFNTKALYPYPLMNISADLGLPPFELLPGFYITGLALSLQINEPPGDEMFQDIAIGIVATTTDLEFFLAITQDMDMVSISGGPLPTYTATLDNLAQSTLGNAILPAGTDFSTFLPGPLSDAFTSIEFNGFTMVLALGDEKQVTYATFSIGEKTGSAVNLGLFSLTGFTLEVSWFTPGSTGSIARIGVGAQAAIPVDVFKDPFDFSIAVTVVNGSATIDTIEARYDGSITLTDIIKEISPGSTIPEVLNDLSFSRFMVRADPGGDSFTCSCSGNLDLEIMSQPLVAAFQLMLNKNATTTSYELSAGFVIGDGAFLFDMSLVSGGDSSLFQFTAKADQIPVSQLVEDLFGAIDIDLSLLPEVVLTDLTLNYNTPSDGFSSLDASFSFDTNYTGEINIAAQKMGSPAQWEFVAAAGLGTTNPVDIGASLPLVGSELAGDFELKESWLIITSKKPTGITIPAASHLTIKPGVSFAFDLILAGQAQTVMLPVVGYPAPEQQQTLRVMQSVVTDSTTPAAPAKPTGSIPIQKQIGPLFIDSIAITYANQVLACSLNASMSLGPLDVSLNGFSFGSSLSAFSPVFNLDGLGIEYAGTGLTIEGAIIRIPDSQLAPGVSLQFDGDLIVQAGQWGLTGLASYAQMTNGMPSFFIFAELNLPPGGPPFFIVEGLMGGFGYNRSLLIPSFDKVQDFPLLAFGGPSTGSARDQAMNTLQVLEGQQPGPDGTKTVWIAPKEGEYWLAAGVKFTSFEIIQGQLLLVAGFGNSLQFSLLGLAWLSLPQGASISDSFVYVELQMAAVLKPADGYFSVAASLTANSFVLTKDCHLTGGFAFNLWFGDNPNAGQFVITAGGYHPAFVAPSYYPQVARLGFNWQVSGDITIRGGSYFALTPSCGMAGGSLEALFQSGDIKAWFTAQADMLVTWNPFSFVAHMSIEIGASVRIDLLVCSVTVSVSLGASLDLWGPPLGGRVSVYIVVVTVTIGFGSNDALNRNKQPLDWKGFTALLPAPADVCKIVVNSGLTQTLQRDNTTGAIIYSSDAPVNGNTSKLWIVRSGSFSFTTQSNIPASHLTYGTGDNHPANIAADAGGITIRPMNLPDVASVHNLQISFNTPGGEPVGDSTWLTPSQGKMAATLWGVPLKDSNGNFIQNPSAPSADTTDLLLTGYTVNTPAPVAGATFGLVPMATLKEEYILAGIAQNPLSTHPVGSALYQPAAAAAAIADIAGIGTTALTNRNMLYAVLSDTSNNIYTGANDGMLEMAARAGNLFTDAPMEQS